MWLVGRSKVSCHMLSTWHHFDAKHGVGRIPFFLWKNSKMPRIRSNIASQKVHHDWPRAEDYCDSIIWVKESDQVTNGSKHFQDHGLQTITVIWTSLIEFLLQVAPCSWYIIDFINCTLDSGGSWFCEYLIQDRVIIRPQWMYACITSCKMPTDFLYHFSMSAAWNSTSWKSGHCIWSHMVWKT